MGACYMEAAHYVLEVCIGMTKNREFYHVHYCSLIWACHCEEEEK